MMKNMKTKAFVLVSLFVAMAVGYQNCGDSAGSGYNVAGSNGSNLSTPGGNGDIAVIAEARTASVISANRVMDSMVSCLGTIEPSDATRQEYDRLKGSCSVEGSANSISQPMLAAFTILGGEACNDLINIEEQRAQGERRIFNSVDFDAGPNANFNAISDVVRRLSRSCWGRNETSQELRDLEIGVSQAFGNANGARNTRMSMLYLCTIMVSSFNSIEM